MHLQRKLFRNISLLVLCVVTWYNDCLRIIFICLMSWLWALYPEFMLTSFSNSLIYVVLIILFVSVPNLKIILIVYLVFLICDLSWHVIFSLVKFNRRWSVWWDKGIFLLLSSVTVTTTNLIHYQLTIFTLRWLSTSIVTLFFGGISKKWGLLENIK